MNALLLLQKVKTDRDISTVKDKWGSIELPTSMVMGVKTNKFVRLKAKAERRNPSWYFSVVDDDFHGCRYPNEATEMAQHTATIVKYAGNILLCKLPNWCLGRFLLSKKEIS